MFEMRLSFILALLPVIIAQTPPSSGFNASPGGTQAQSQQQNVPVVYNQQPTPYDPTHGGQQLNTGSPGSYPQQYHTGSGGPLPHQYSTGSYGQQQGLTQQWQGQAPVQSYPSYSSQTGAWSQYPPPQPYPLSFFNMWRYMTDPSMLRRNPWMYATLFDGFFDFGF